MKVLSKVIFVLTVLLLGVTHLFAQAIDTAWTRTYGGTSWDEGNSVQQTTDGGYIIAGGTASYGAGSDDVYLIKTDSLGDTLWTKTYGGSESDGGNSVQQTTDGGYIVAGTIYDEGSYSDDVYLIKTNSSGDTLWTRTYGGTDYDEGYSVQQTTDGGYIVAGETSSYGAGFEDVYLIKTNSSGDTLWTRTYGTDGGQCRSVQQTTDGGYIVAGTIYDEGSYSADVYLIKTNSSGDTLWTRTYGGTGYDEGRSVQQTSDGGYIVSGYTESYGAGEYDVYLLKTDSLGDTLWTRTYGGDSLAYGNSVQQTTDGGYIVAGATTAGVGDNAYLVKTDSLGDTLWTRTYGGTDDGEGRSVQQTTDGGYIIAGYTASFGPTGYDVYLIKIKPEGSGIEEKISSVLFSLSPANPNPFTSETTVRYELGKAVNVDVSVYNTLGQKVRDLYSGKQSSGVHSVIWDGTEESGEKSSSGVYLLKIKGEGEEASTKVMFVR